MSLIPKTWKPCDDIFAKSLFDTILKEAESLGYKPQIQCGLMMFNRTSALGECRSTKGYDSHYNSVIGINREILKSDAVLAEVLVHEIAHSIMPLDGHSHAWKTVGDKIGKRFDVSVERVRDKSYYENLGVFVERKKVETKYVVECPCCHQKWKYGKLCKTVQHPELYRCCKCEKELVRIK